MIDCRSVAGTLNGNGKAAGSATQQNAETGMLVAFVGNRSSGPLDVATSCLANRSPHGRQDFASETFVACFHPTQDPISSTDGSAHAMGTGSKGGCSSHAVCVTGQAVAVRTANTGANGHGVADEVTHTIDQVQGQAIAFKPGQSEAAGGTFVTEEFTPTMQAQNNGSTAVPAVAFKPSHYTRGKDGRPSEVTPPLSADADKGDQDTIVASPFTKAKRAQSSSDDESWVPGEVAPTQNQFDQGDTRASGGGKVENPTMQSLRSSAEYSYQFIRNAMQVRRLCPSECEALQGFPIGYTDVHYRKKPAADGPRYRALGNSMAVPCMWWLGYRIHNATRGDNHR